MEEAQCFGCFPKSKGKASGLGEDPVVVELGDNGKFDNFSSELVSDELDEEVEEGSQGGMKVSVARDYYVTGIVAFLALSVVIIMCVWSGQGLLAPHELVHQVNTLSRPGEMHGTLYSTPADIVLHGTEQAYFEVRLITGAVKDFSAHRRLSSGGIPRVQRRRLSRSISGLSRLLAHTTVASPVRLLSSDHGDAHAAAHDAPVVDPYAGHDAGHGAGNSTGHGHSAAVITGNLTYTLLADGKEFFTKTIALKGNEEVEHFQGIDVASLAPGGAKVFSAVVTCYRSDGNQQPFLLQVLRMPPAGKYREWIGIIIFVISFAGIVLEPVHRVYAAMMGSITGVCTVTAIQETKHLHDVTAMVDWGTLMLLFSMMILMRMLTLTGFFNWFAVKIVKLSKQNPKVLYHAMCHIIGYLSMWLDNVTCVLLFGPLVYNLAKKMSLNPRPIYLSMTILATIGGTGTMIGDPPNIVIGSKMGIGFESFLKYNFIIVTFVLVPISSYLLYWRLKDQLLREGSDEKLDLEQLEADNQITDMPMFMKLMAILLALLFALLLSPLHHVEVAWFCVMCMFGAAMLFEPHHLHKYLEHVEWDTLLFFALLFVLVECLCELGTISMIGQAVKDCIGAFPDNIRLAAGITIILWVAAMGSAFLESLPFTTALIYVMLDLRYNPIGGIDPDYFAWSLSFGACIGGIGSITGSSANLVCMAVGGRFSETDEDKVKGGDFLRYGFPLLCVLMVISNVYFIILFCVCGAAPM